jgi:hypothetical protein
VFSAVTPDPSSRLGPNKTRKTVWKHDCFYVFLKVAQTYLEVGGAQANFARIKKTVKHDVFSILSLQNTIRSSGPQPNAPLF